MSRFLFFFVLGFFSAFIFFASSLMLEIVLPCTQNCEQVKPTEQKEERVSKNIKYFKKMKEDELNPKFTIDKEVSLEITDANGNGDIVVDLHTKEKITKEDISSVIKWLPRIKKDYELHISTPEDMIVYKLSGRKKVEECFSYEIGCVK